MSVILAAYTRIVGEFPFVNRFIVNKKIYARNEFNVGMVVLKAGDSGNGTMSKVNFDPADTIFEVNNKIMKYIDSNRDTANQNSTDKLVHILLSIPGLLRFGVVFLKWLDKHGLLPRAIINASPFHTSMSFSNLASIRTNHIFHHIYNFGTTSVFMTIGNTVEVPKQDKEGNITFEKCIPFGVVMDERVCSGAYFAKAFRSFRNYLANPALLEVAPPPEKVIREVPYIVQK